MSLDIIYEEDSLSEESEFSEVTDTALVYEEVDSTSSSFILGKISGPVFGPVGVINGNNRIYLPEILDKITTDPYVTNMISARCLLGEAHHPGDARGSIWLDESCVSWVDLHKEGNMLYGTADILDTPKGRIVNTLVKYGSKLGVSARASGKAVKGVYQGTRADIIKPENYSFKTFDVVLNPGFATARPTFTSESITEEGSEPSLYDAFKSLIEENKCDKDTVRSYISYCEDESLKELLPLLDEEASTDVDKITILEEKIRTLEEDNKSYQEYISELNNITTSLREEIVDTQTISADSSIEELMSLIEEQSKAISDLELLSKSYMETSGNSLHLYDELTIKYSDLQSSYEELEGKYNDLTESYNNLSDNYEQRIASSEELLNDSNSARIALNTENIRLREEVISLNTTLSSLKEELSSVQGKLSSLKEENNKAPITEESITNLPNIHRSKLRNPVDITASFIDSSINEEQTYKGNPSRRALIKSIN